MKKIVGKVARAKWGAFVVPLSLCFILANCDKPPPKKETKAPPPSVVVEVAQMKDLAQADEFKGRIEAIDSVELRARVPGYLEKRPFKEGGLVKAGDLLFEIERKPYEIALNQAKANLKSAQGALVNAQKDFERKDELAKKQFSSEAVRDQAQATLTQAQGAILAREADVEQAKLNLSYTRIVAPLTGLIGRSTYSKGAYLSPQSSSLATLVQHDPIYVTFPVTQRLLLEVRKDGRTADGVFVELILSDGSTYEHKGKINFADVQSTSTTDSVLVRATFPNPDQLLIDKQVIDARVVGKEPEKKLVIPQPALLVDQLGSYVLAVDKNNKVVQKRLKTGQQRGVYMEVVSGLEDGDKVVVSGLQKIRPGIVVKPEIAEKQLSQ